VRVIPNGTAVIVGSACFALANFISGDAGAAALVWNSGSWGDTWQTQMTSSNDTDGDGVVNAADAFPINNAEWSDADMDGIGNHADIDDDNDGVADFPDPDDDNDGISDVREIKLGTDPNDPDSRPALITPWTPLLFEKNTRLEPP